MGKILNPVPPEMDGTEALTIVMDKLCTSNDDLIEAFRVLQPDLSYVKESTGYYRLDNPWWFAGRTLVGSIRVGPKTFTALRGAPEHFNIPSLQPWKIIKPVMLVGKLRCPKAVEP